MLLNVDIRALTSHDIDPEKSVRQIFRTFSDDETTLWIADAESGRILVSGKEELEGTDTASLGPANADQTGSLMKAMKSSPRR